MFYFSLDVLRRMRIHGYFPSYVAHSYICLAFIRSFVYLVYGERLYNETSKTQPINLSLFLDKTKRCCCSFGFLTSQLLASVVSCTFLFSCCLWFELILTYIFSCDPFFPLAGSSQLVQLQQACLLRLLL